MTFLALPWFVLATTGSPTRMSLVLAVEVLPTALLGIPSGSLVSRLGARTTMLLSDLVRAPLVALVPVLHWAGHLSFATLLVVVFALGAFTAPYASAQRSIVPELFGDDETLVAKASGLFGGAAQVPLLVGPALAGVLIAAFGTPPLLVVDAATFLFAFVAVLGFVRGGRRIPADAESRGLLAGVRYLLRDPVLGPITLTIVVLDGSVNTVAVAVPLLAFTRYGRDPHVAGWIFTGFGVGMVVGSVLIVKLLDRFRPLRLAAAGILAAILPLWLVALPLPWPAAFAFVAVCGLFVPLVNAPIMALLTTRPPASVRAKVMTTVMTASALGGPIGRLLIGPLFSWGGNAAVWCAIGAGGTIGALLFIAAAVRASEPVPEAVAGTA